MSQHHNLWRLYEGGHVSQHGLTSVEKTPVTRRAYKVTEGHQSSIVRLRWHSPENTAQVLGVSKLCSDKGCSSDFHIIANITLTAVCYQDQ